MSLSWKKHYHLATFTRRAWTSAPTSLPAEALHPEDTMPLDPVAVNYLEALARANLPRPTAGTPEEARELLIRRKALFPDPRPEVARVEDRAIPSPAGDVPIRVYTPAGGGPFPITIFFHGGGWVLGSIETHDGLARLLANAAKCVVLSVDYRLAPEHPFPAAVDDAYAATAWAARDGAEVGGDCTRLAVAGDSAGGNLAAVVCLLARDRGEPAIGFQLLMYPIIDCDFETASYRDNAEGYSLTRAAMQWAWDRYLPEVDARTNPCASPLRATSLHGLPPAYVITAEFDPLKSEGQAYANRLHEDGVPTTLRDYPGLLHGFVGSPGVYPQAAAAIHDAATSLRAALGSSPADTDLPRACQVRLPLYNLRGPDHPGFACAPGRRPFGPRGNRSQPSARLSKSPKALTRFEEGHARGGLRRRGAADLFADVRWVAVGRLRRSALDSNHALERLVSVRELSFRKTWTSRTYRPGTGNGKASSQGDKGTVRAGDIHPNRTYCRGNSPTIWLIARCWPSFSAANRTARVYRVEAGRTASTESPRFVTRTSKVCAWPTVHTFGSSPLNAATGCLVRGVVGVGRDRREHW